MLVLVTGDADPPPPPRLVLGRFRPVDLARLLLVFVPLAPGLIFLAVASLNDPLWPAQDPTPEMQAEYARASLRARELYLAGAVTLLAGTVGMGVVIWKIARTHPEDPTAASENETEV